MSTIPRRAVIKNRELGTMKPATTLALKDKKILGHIFFHLPWAGLVNAAEVCKDWRVVVHGPECKKRLQLHLTWLDDEGFSSSNPFAEAHLHPSQDMKEHGGVGAHHRTSKRASHCLCSSINLERLSLSIHSPQEMLARACRSLATLWRNAAA